NSALYMVLHEILRINRIDLGDGLRRAQVGSRLVRGIELGKAHSPASPGRRKVRHAQPHGIVPARSEYLRVNAVAWLACFVWCKRSRRSRSDYRARGNFYRRG